MTTIASTPKSTAAIAVVAHASGVASAQSAFADIVIAVPGPPGPTGPQGMPGEAIPNAASVAETDILAGQPVFVDQSTRLMGLAQADIYARRACIGLARADVAAGMVGDAEGKVLSLDDWTAATGAASLKSGATYFLACAPGQLMLTPPALTDFGCSVVRVGIATGPQTLAIIHAPPILL